MMNCVERIWKQIHMAMAKNPFPAELSTLFEIHVGAIYEARFENVVTSLVYI